MRLYGQEEQEVYGSIHDNIRFNVTYKYLDKKKKQISKKYSLNSALTAP